MKTYARDTYTGKVAEVPAKWLGHPVLGKNLVPAEEGDKDYEPELYAAKTVEEYVESKKSRKKFDEVVEIVGSPIEIEEI